MHKTARMRRNATWQNATWQGVMWRMAVGTIGGMVVVRQQWRFGHLDRSHYGWARFAIVATLAVTALVLPTVHRALPRPAAPAVLVASWAAVIYGCIPETGRQPGLLAMVFGLAAWELLGRTTLPWPAHLAQIFLLISSGVFGTAGWPSALLGTLFGIWPLVLVTGASLVAPLATRRSISPARIEVIAALGCIGSVVVARTGALVHPGIRGAMVAIAVVAAIEVVAALLLIRFENLPLAGERHRSSPPRQRTRGAAATVRQGVTAPGESP